MYSPRSASTSPRRRLGGRRCRQCVNFTEKTCSNILTLFPLCFVYGLSTWATWVQAKLGFSSEPDSWVGHYSAYTGIGLYIMVCWCYTAAVFTDPGSTTSTNSTSHTSRGGYLPVHASEEPTPTLPTFSSLTVKSTGSGRYCKKCQASKPDRAHHCSTCQRCVLKMDHHCPWLATCVGLHNHKSFILFLVYTALFCIFCFLVAGTWMWNGMDIKDADGPDMSLHLIFLALLSGLFGIVLSGFSAWHIYLCGIGKTTIESLVQTKYLAPIRTYMEAHQQNQQNQQLEDSRRGRSVTSDETAFDTIQRSIGTLRDHIIEAHGNSIPGVTRPEEGEERMSPRTSRSPSMAFGGSPFTDGQVGSIGVGVGSGQRSSPSVRADVVSAVAASTTTAGQPSRYSPHPGTPVPDPYLNTTTKSAISAYHAAEQRREAERYLSYVDELEWAKLPNAFDLGWRRNLSEVFGEWWVLWVVPVVYGSGNGSGGGRVGWEWDISPRWIQERDALLRRRIHARGAYEGTIGGGNRSVSGASKPSPTGPRYSNPAPAPVPMQPPLITKAGSGSGTIHGDGIANTSASTAANATFPSPTTQPLRKPRTATPTKTWNDIPDDMLTLGPGGKGSKRATARARLPSPPSALPPLAPPPTSSISPPAVTPTSTEPPPTLPSTASTASARPSLGPRPSVRPSFISHLSGTGTSTAASRTSSSVASNTPSKQSSGPGAAGFGFRAGVSASLGMAGSSSLLNKRYSPAGSVRSVSPVGGRGSSAVGPAGAEATSGGGDGNKSPLTVDSVGSSPEHDDLDVD